MTPPFVYSEKGKKTAGQIDLLEAVSRAETFNRGKNVSNRTVPNDNLKKEHRKPG